RQIGEGGLTKLARSRILVVSKPLEPDPDGDLMPPAGDLQIIRIREEIPAIEDARGVVRTGRGDAVVAARGGDPAADDNASRTRAFDEGQVRRYRSQQRRRKLESRSRESGGKDVEHLRRNDVRFLYACHLRAKPGERSE